MLKLEGYPAYVRDKKLYVSHRGQSLEKLTGHFRAADPHCHVPFDDRQYTITLRFATEVRTLPEFLGKECILTASPARYSFVVRGDATGEEIYGYKLLLENIEIKPLRF